eukprot:1413769-Heterocapsa_arctica.AAC.1
MKKRKNVQVIELPGVPSMRWFVPVLGVGTASKCAVLVLLRAWQVAAASFRADFEIWEHAEPTVATIQAEWADMSREEVFQEIAAIRAKDTFIIYCKI